MSVDDPTEDRECPLCLEKLEIDDINFYPCTCKYQVCRFCWHRIRTDENGLCPACRKPYPEDPANFQPVTPMEMQQFKTERKQKEKKRNISECRKYLSAYRVLQRNLVYVVGLSPRIADPDILRRSDYFGKYGKVVKVAVGTLPSNTGSSPVHTAYVTFSKVDDALRTIQETNCLVYDGRMIKTSLGTTKYCSNFLRGQPCHKQECMYLHEVAPPDLSFTKEDMHQGKHTEYERKLLDKLIAADAAAATNGRSESASETNSGYSLVIDTISNSNSQPVQQEPQPIFERATVEKPLIEFKRRTPTPPPKRKPSIPSVAVPIQAPAPSAVVEPEPVIQSEPEQRLVENVTVLDPIFPPTTKVVEAPVRPKTPPSSSCPRYEDDDLGFDPFAESMKGLQELIAEAELETTPQVASRTSLRDSIYHKGPLDYPDSNFGQDFLSSSSISNHYNGSRLSNNNPYGNVLSNYQNYSSQPSNNLYGHQNHLEKQYNGGLGAFGFLMGNGTSIGGNNSRSTAPEPPGFSGYSSRFNNGQSTYNPPSNNVQDSREVFKSMLPNVNVQFVSSNDTRGLFSSSPNNFGPPPGMGISNMNMNGIGSNAIASNGHNSSGLGMNQFNRVNNTYRSQIDMSMFNHNAAVRPQMFDSHPPGLHKWMTSPPPGFDSARPGS